MKSLIKLIGIIAIVAIIGFSMTACDNDNGDNSGADPLNGIWTAGNMEWTFNNGSYELKENGKLDEKGTYTTRASSRNTAPGKGIMELTPTHINGENWYISSPGDLEPMWYSKDDLKKQGIGDDKLEIIFEIEEKDYELNGNTLTLDGTPYSKQGGTNKAATPTATPPQGIYASTQNVTLASTTTGAKIYYTLNGNTPTVSSTLYTTAISISMTATLKAIAVREGMINSEVLTANYTIGGGSPTWTAVADSKFEGNNIRGITYGNGKFVAVGNGGKMAHSTDGITWTAVSDSKFGVRDNTILCIAWGNNKFVAGGGHFGMTSVASSYKMSYSEDGINWTVVPNSPSKPQHILQINGIAYGNGKFVAVGETGHISYSTDGMNWTTVEDSTFVGENSSNNPIYGIAWGNDKFVAVGDNGQMAHSADGITWTKVENSQFFQYYPIWSIVWGNDKFVAVGGGTAYSANGITWTKGPYKEFNSIAWGSNRFVAVGSFGSISYSADGIDWTNVTDSTFGNSNNTITGVAWGNNKFVAVGQNGKIAYWQP